ncbi:Glycosyl transferase, family 2 (fragment) [Candidatus Sulfopaludibacter sp. SbA6]
MKPETKIAFWVSAGRIAGRLRPRRRTVTPWPPRETPAGISVVIPSRNGKDLLAAQMPGIVRELERFPAEIVVVDNGSDDGTGDWLRSAWAQVQLETSPAPLSFARAVNRGIRRARYSHVCLLNNDMIIAQNFFAALVRAFEQVPDLFCATAQILFPEGVRREETGKAVYFQPGPADFPIRCDEPLPGEDLTWVLYGSGGCSLYDAAMLRALGSLDPAYDPAYVEDLDIGYRAWQRGWPTVYVAGAVLEHRHRATSSRYYTGEQLEEILEINYLRFLARAVASSGVFRTLWEQALHRLCLRAAAADVPRKALRAAPWIALSGGPGYLADYSEELLLALGSGAIAVFPGGVPPADPRAVIASTGIGRQTRQGVVLVALSERLEPPPAAVLSQCAEVVVVRRSGGSLAFRAALQQTVRKWQPEVAYLDGPDMAQYAADCAPARALTRPPS